MKGLKSIVFATAFVVSGSASAVPILHTSLASYLAAGGGGVVENFDGQANGNIASGTDVGPFTLTYAGTTAPPSIQGGADKQLEFNIFSGTQSGAPKSVTLTFDSSTTAFGAVFTTPSSGGGVNVTVNSVLFNDIGAGIGGGIGFLGFTDVAGFSSLVMTSAASGSGETFAIDDVRLAATIAPEPTTLALGALGLMALWRRRSR